MLNIEKMFVLIAARPQIRTVEIADIIDCDVEQVQPALQPHIDCGDLTLIEVTAPNGRPANGFMITRQFMDGELYQALLPAIQAQRAVDGWAQPEPSPITALPTRMLKIKSVLASRVAPGPEVGTPVQRTAAPPVPRYERVMTRKLIEYLTKHGPCTATELRRAMGLRDGRGVGRELKIPVLDGRVVRKGRLYAMLASELSSATAAPFRFTCAPDGSIAIRRNGKLAITLAPAECVLLAPMMAKVVMGVQA